MRKACDGMVEVVRPLRVQPVAAALDGIEQAGVVQVALGDDDRRPTPPGAGLFGHLLDRPQDVPGAQVEDGVDGIETQAVEVELLEPHPHVVQHEVAHGVAAVPVVVDRGAPRGLVPVVEVGAELAQVVPFGAEVVVDDVQDRSPVRGVAGVHQPLQAVRPAVAVLRGVGEHAVVAPVA